MSDLSNQQILNIAKQYSLPVNGIFLKDQIPLSAIKNGFCVYNLDHTHRGNVGTHWTCSYTTPEGTVYFDSFGYPPSMETESYIKRRFSCNFYNHREIQDYYSEKCGLYCIAFGVYMNKSPRGLIETANEFIKLFTNCTTTNELILTNMMRYLRLLSTGLKNRCTPLTDEDGTLSIHPG